MFNKDLSLGEIRLQQWNPHRTVNTVMWVEYGYNGTGTQVDLSGNSDAVDGTVTGMTQSDHYPGRQLFGVGDERVFVVVPAAARRRLIRVY